MNLERWRRIKEILDVSLRLDPQERNEYLARMCRGDDELREEVESLIEAHEQAGDMFEAPPAPLREPPDPMLGARIGPYEIVEQVGSGGMGAVYRAVRADEAFRKEVAIKLVHRGLDSHNILSRFRQERQIMASLEHPNIAILLDGGSTSEGLPYFVMEYIKGKPIHVYCDEHHLGVAERLRLFLTVSEAVHFAHQRGVIHRDIKPGNILITEAGVPKLVDFGVAKILNPDMGISTVDSGITLLPPMTPEYASPEQLNGEAVTEASDVYSLGVVLCELLAGRRPEGASSAPSRLVDKQDKRCRELAGDLDSIVLKATSKEPEGRYVSAEQLVADIRRRLEGRAVLARKHSPVYLARKFVHRHRAAMATAAAVCVAFALLLAAVSWNRERDPVAPPSLVPFTSLAGNESQASFSPDGARIVFVWSGEDGGNSDIYLKLREGGEPLRLTSDPAEDLGPVWSPDGSRIAFVRASAEEMAVFLSSPSFGKPAKIATLDPNRSDVVGRPLDWSPDGRHLAAADKSSPLAPFRITLLGAGDGRKREVTLPPANSIGDVCPAFSPDGKSLAFIRAISSGVNDIYVVRLDGGEPLRLTSDGRYILGLAWTPGGEDIVFSSNRGGNHALWRVSASGGAPVRVPLAGPNASDPGFSRDGRYLIYSQFVEDANIWRLHFDTARARVLDRGKLIFSTQYDSSPQYSPDGTRVAFRSNRSGNHEIWVCDSEGGRPVQLTRLGGTLAGTPRWSPDGREIAFDSRPAGQADIYAAAASGGAPRQITHDNSEDVVPSWSRDGLWIYFASSRSGAMQVWKAPAAGGPARQVTRYGGFAAFESPDGKFLYYAKGRSVSGLWRMPIGGGAEEPVIERLKPGFWGYWAVVPGGIYFVDGPEPQTAAEISFYAFSNRRVRTVAPIEKPPAVADSAFAVSPDGRSILYTQFDQRGSDIMLIENYRLRD